MVRATPIEFGDSLVSVFFKKEIVLSHVFAVEIGGVDLRKMNA